MLKSFEKTAKKGRWICNAGEVHPDCILNEGLLEICTDHVPKGVLTNAKQPTFAPAVASRNDVGGSDKSSCSADDVFNFFKAKQRNTKLARTQSKTNEEEWIAQQKKLNHSPIERKCETKAKAANVVTALPYTSFNRRENVCPEMSPTKSARSFIGENVMQQVPGMVTI